MLPLLLLLACRGVIDRDGDGYKASEDCADRDPTRHPGAEEVCNGVDDDCDGEKDEPSAVDATTWLLDLDQDGYGNDERALVLCDRPGGYVELGGDCADADPARNPGVDELCNEVDDDCDGEVDEDSAVDAPTWYADGDADGYGDPDGAAPACEQPAGFVTNARDCDDGDDAVHPDQVDTPDNGVDDDCDGGVDEATLWLAELAGAVSRSHGGAYGAPVAVGDVDGDGSADLLVGAVQTEVDGAGTLAGGAWVHTGSEDWLLTGQEDGDRAGAALAAGDLDGDGYADLVVGAPEALTVGTESGSGYVLAGPLSEGGKLNSLRVAKLRAEDPHDHLGEALAVRDGLLAVGAPRYDYDGDGARSGAVYLLVGPLEDTVDVATQALAVVAGPTGGAELGQSLDLGDLDGDGVLDLVLGGPGVDLTEAADGVEAEDVGGAYLALGPLSGASSVEDAEALRGAVEGDLLGTVVRFVGDLDGDGLADVAVGAPGDDAGGDDAGAVHLLTGGSWQVTATLLGEAAGALAGSAVAGGADLDGDGRGDVVVGAPGGPSVHLVLDALGGTTLLGGAAATLHGQEGDEVGAAVALDPALGLLAGAPAGDLLWQVDPALVLP